MSGTGEERWRTPHGQQNSQPPNQNRHNNQQQRQGSSRESGGSQGRQSNTNQGDWTAHGPPQEQHVPVNGFNVQEVREALKTAYNSVVPEDGKQLKYKPPGTQGRNAKSGGPWALRPNNMANGKDFFLELRKQISATQQTNQRAGG